jgi:hypothetical protein
VNDFIPAALAVAKNLRLPQPMALAADHGHKLLAVTIRQRWAAAAAFILSVS